MLLHEARLPRPERSAATPPEGDPQREGVAPLRWWRLAAVTLALIALSVFLRSREEASTTSPIVASKPTASSPATTRRTKPIRDIEVGERVLAENPEFEANRRAGSEEPDWSQWLRLSLAMDKADGSELNIELLRSEDWIASHLLIAVQQQAPIGLKDDTSPVIHAAASENVPYSILRPLYQDFIAQQGLLDAAGFATVGCFVELNLPELGVTGVALVRQLRPAPHISPGSGSVVTATFQHSGGNVIDLIIGNDREHETVGTTDNHPFWSEDQQRYVPAGTLLPGERVRTYLGETQHIVAVKPRPGPEEVYNLEVHSEHVYYVGRFGTLVHNSYLSDEKAERYADAMLDIIIGRKYPADEVASTLQTIHGSRLTRKQTSQVRQSLRERFVNGYRAGDSIDFGDWATQINGRSTLHIRHSDLRRMRVEASRYSDPRKALHDLHVAHIVKKYTLDPGIFNSQTLHHMGTTGHVQIIDMEIHKLFGGHRGLADWHYWWSLEMIEWRFKADLGLVFDKEVLSRITNKNGFFALQMDPEYLAALPRIAGREPNACYFQLPNGTCKELAWFVGISDEKTVFPGEFVDSYMPSHGVDTRVFDRSMPSILNTEINVFDRGAILIPIAALVTNGIRPESLVWESFDWPIADCVCLDRSTDPQSVVYLRTGEMTTAVVDEAFQDGEKELDFSASTMLIASSFSQFCQMLSSKRQ